MATVQDSQLILTVSRPTDRYLDAVVVIPAPSPGMITGAEYREDPAHTFGVQPFYTHEPDLRFGLAIFQQPQGDGYPKSDDDPAMRMIQALAYKDSMTNLPVQSEFLWNVTHAVRNTLALQFTAYRVFLEPLVTDPSHIAPLVDGDSEGTQQRTTVHMGISCTSEGVGCVYLRSVGPREFKIEHMMRQGSQASMIDRISDYRPRLQSRKHLMSLLSPGESSSSLREEYAARVRTATKWRVRKTLGEHVDVSVDTDSDWPETITPELFAALDALYDV